MLRYKTKIGIAGLALVLIIVIIIILFPKSELSSLKDYEEKGNVIAFKINDEVFTYTDLQHHIRYEAYLKEYGNPFADADPKVTLVDQFFHALYKRDAKARGIMLSENEIKANLVAMVEESNDIGGGLREVQEAMGVDELFFTQNFMYKLMETELTKQYLYPTGIHHIFQFKAFDRATTQSKDMKHYHQFLVRTYYDELYTEDSTIAKQIKKLAK